MRGIIFFLVVIALSPVAAYGQIFPYAEKSDLANGSEKGELTIKIADPVLERGERYSIEYSFHVTNSSYTVYNWQFIRLKPLPGQLAIYGSDKKYVGDLIAFTMGSQVGVGDNDWTLLHDGDRVGSVLSFRAGSVPNTKYDWAGNPLPTGDYYIQLILYKAFVSPNPYRVVGEKIDFYQTFDRGELCRSNMVKVQIVN